MKSLIYKDEEYFENDEMYGCAYFPDAEIYMNLTRLWGDAKGKGNTKINNFIKNYTKVFIHEVLHVIIDEITSDDRLEEEDNILHNITGSDKLTVNNKHLFLKILTE